MRSIVDALADLGKKVTGKDIEVTDENLMMYGEDIVEVIDEITNNYEGGGSTEAESFILTADASWLSGEEVEIEDEENITILNQMKEAIKDGKNVSVGLKLPVDETPFNTYQAMKPFYEAGDDGYGEYENCTVAGFGYIGMFGYTFVDFKLTYSLADGGKWLITLTPLFMGE